MRKGTSDSEKDTEHPSLDISTVHKHYGASRIPESRGWRTMRCPFHDDKHPSARVSTEKGAFWCPACGMKGDAIKIVMIQERLDFREACDFAADVFGASNQHIRKPDQRPDREQWSHTLYD